MVDIYNFEKYFQVPWQCLPPPTSNQHKHTKLGETAPHPNHTSLATSETFVLTIIFYVKHTALALPTAPLNGPQLLKPGAVSKAAATAQTRYQLEIAGLSNETINAFNDMRGEPAEHGDDDTAWVDYGDTEIEPLPENMNHNETITHAIRDFVDHLWGYHKHHDGCTWQHQLQSINANWAPLIPTLVNTYLTWNSLQFGISLQPQCPTAPELSFTIHIVDIFTALVSEGFLGNAPHNSLIAISLLLADTFDLYLTILHEIERRVQTVLNHDTPNWQVLNACPPCSYELDDEPPLKYSCMYVMDGGNSAKHMVTIGDRQCGDTHIYAESDYLLSCVFVDHFANEVQSRSTLDGPDDHPIIPKAEEDDSVVSSAQVIAEDCSRNWKAAADDDKKKMWAIFDETSIFIAACRHGSMLWYANIIKSVKYPLAIVAKILDVIGEHTLGAYDIGCPAFMEKQSHLCIDAFHGYAHNYICQTQHHPLGIEGAGLEDFGVAESIFSASNALASVIRYASPYHRHVFLDLFFKQWDEDKYSNLGTMLLNNYWQAQQVISTETIMLREAMSSLGIQEEDLMNWRSEEIQYFQTLGKEPEWDVHAIVYVELLQQMQELESQASVSFARFVSSALDNYQFSAPSQTNFYSVNLSQTPKLEMQRHYATERLASIQHNVISMEPKLSIANWWSPLSAEYQETLTYMTLCKYHKALDNIQHLVVQRLFKLQRLNVSRTAIQNAVKKYNEAASELRPPWPPLEWSKVSHFSFLDEFNLLHETCQDICNKPWTKPAVRETMRQHLHIQRAKKEIVYCNIEVRHLQTAIVVENEEFTCVLAALDAANSLIFVAVKEHSICRHRINSQLLSCINQTHSLPGFSRDKSCGVRKGTSSDRAPSTVAPAQGDSEQPQSDDSEEDAFDEDDGVERDIGILVEYLSDLALHP
ncbi:uncharacterized protein EDB91DRAFT_1080328 [Suillus paluster]|uniref:uncharacterized protein n=1 Tax=Suillus paluster TaxID=48578 RepID=UPI001B88613F|nr:uncharacterized protein EDB91DRAFT_1080328 [Suillus paluster]KAG1745409.1 hypothetical protein EDB91DRAFT_1080328 [Suillus paluster]